MKILFITYYFAPYNTIGAVRTTRTAEKLIEMGHDVKVISANEQYLPKNLSTSFPKENVHYVKWFNIEKYFSKKTLENNVFDLKNKSIYKKAKYFLVATLKSFYLNFIAVPDRFIVWFWPARKHAISLINDGWEPDLIYASAIPYTSLLIAKSLSEYYSVPWVGELRDLWADNHYSKESWISQLIEKKTLASASHLITVSKPLAESLDKKYKCPVSVIYNAYDKLDFEEKHDFKKVDKKNKLKIVYTGVIYKDKRDPTPLFLAILGSDLVRAKVQVDFYGPDLSYISFLIDKYKLEDCVFVHKEVTRKESIRLQKESDILLLLTWNNPEEKGILTGKLFEYIGSGQAILSLGAIWDDASRIIIDNEFGIASNTPSDIESFILKFQQCDYSNLKSRASYERTFQVEKLVSIFELYL